MLSYSGITVLSFTNKVVKVPLQKFVRSLYGVPRTLQYFHKVLKMRQKCLKIKNIFTKFRDKEPENNCLN